MAEATWKPAKKAFTKAQKRRRGEIREEFNWTVEIPLKRPEMLKLGGMSKWLDRLMELNNAYVEASDGRDELINNVMLLFAASAPSLFNKVTTQPDKLTDGERDAAIAILEIAVKESPEE